MLTLKEPLSLRCCRPPSNRAEAFGEKILGNYALLASSFGPRELLFLLTAPPELPENLGGMTTLVAENHLSEQHTVLLNVVNQVVNRILLSHQSDFTYQDQVYLTTALHKLGVTDVAQFMGEVRDLREEERTVSTLLALYREEVSRPSGLAAEPPDPADPAIAPPGQAVPPATPAPRYYLHDEVYRRLHTQALYASLNAYNQAFFHVSAIARGQLLRLSEELRVSNHLALSSLRAEHLEASTLILSQRLNHYEVGDLLPPPASEEDVLSQAAAAALFSTLEHTLVQRLSQSFGGNTLWQDFRQSLAQTVQTALSRFEAYHSQSALHTWETDRSYHALLTDLYQEETQLLQSRRAVHNLMTQVTGGTVEQTLIYAAPPGRERLEEVHSQTQRDLVAVSQLERELVGLLQEPPGVQRLLLQTVREGSPGVEFPGSPSIPPPAGGEEAFAGQVTLTHAAPGAEVSPPPADGRGEDRPPTPMVYLREGETVTVLPTMPAGPDGSVPPRPVQVPRAAERQTGEETSSAAPTAVIAPDAGRDTTIAAPGETPEGSAPLPGPTVLLEGDPRLRPTAPEDRTPPALLHPDASGGETAPPEARPAHAPAGDPVEVLRRERERLVEYVRQLPPADRPAVYGDDRSPEAAVTRQGEAVRRILAQDGGEARETLMLREVARLDQHNREMLRQLESHHTRQTDTLTAATPDRTKTMADALRALTDPGQVLKALAEQPAPAGEAHLSAETALLLSHADPATRSLLEQVLRHRHDPAETPGPHTLRPGVLSALNAEGATAQREALELIARLEEPARPDSGPGQGSGAAELPAAARAPKGQTPPRPSGPERSPVHFIHRRAQDTLSEELLTRLEERRQTATHHQESTAETVRRQMTAQTELTQVSHQVAAETTEDITALVSRTLARQMGTITDRVYQQMEKRLQTERSRRGRF